MINFRLLVRMALTIFIVTAVGIAVNAQIKSAQIRTINYFMPSSYLALNDPSQAARYLRYYYIIYFLTPLKSDAQAMIGFCYAQSGQWLNAQRAYQHAARLKSNLFWVYYNLALIKARQGQNLQAQQALQKAVALNPQESLEQILTSKIYSDIAVEFHQTPQLLAIRLMEAYQQALVWLRLGYVDQSAKPSIF